MLEALMFILLPHAVWGQSAAPGGEVPPELRPPEGAKLILRAHAKGDQIYTCKQQNGQYSWALKAPEAQLFDERGQVLGRHFAGPTWEASDKSAVTGKMVQAICGAVFPVTKTPKPGSPVCPKCQEIYDATS